MKTERRSESSEGKMAGAIYVRQRIVVCLHLEQVAS